MNRKDLVENFIRHCSDIFPYNDPNYEEKLLEAAENYANEVLNPDSELNRLCELHDKNLIEDEINF